MTSVPAADVEGAVLDQLQKLLVARIWAAAKREGEDEVAEREVTFLLADFVTVWNELFPGEQARIVQLLVERVDVQEDALEVRIRAEGLASLVGDTRARGLVAALRRPSVMPRPWLVALVRRRPVNVVATALAHKTARALWAMLTRQEVWRASEITSLTPASPRRLSLRRNSTQEV